MISRTARRLNAQPLKTFACDRYARIFHASAYNQVFDSKTLLERPEYIRSSWVKSVVNEVIPLTMSVLNTKNVVAVENLAAAVSFCNPLPPVLAGPDDKVGKRRIDDSWVEMCFPFSGDKTLRESLVKSDGVSMRYGKLFEILDGLAADVCYRHVGPELSKGVSIVTASVARMKLLNPISLLNDLKLHAYMTYVGKSSMEVTIDLVSIKETGEPEYIGNTQFIMVARRDNKAADIPGLLLKTDEAKRVFELGKRHLEQRKRNAATSLSLLPPLPQEMSLIHELYLRSKRMKEFNEISRLSAANGLSTVEEQGKSVWMKNLVFKNTEFMHMQNRNIHGKIFGGWLMRTAFELAWVSAACYMGEAGSKLIFVDDIQFVKPVNIGSIMEFTSMVTYQHDNYVVVQVEAVDISPVNIVRTKTNVMHYIFKNEVASTKALPQIMPSTYEESVKYLEGKRSLDKLLGDDL